jgi:hypothetical protein
LQTSQAFGTDNTCHDRLRRRLELTMTIVGLVCKWK